MLIFVLCLTLISAQHAIAQQFGADSPLKGGAPEEVFHFCIALAPSAQPVKLGGRRRR